MGFTKIKMTLNAVFRQALRDTLEELPGTCEDRDTVTVQSGTAVAELCLRKRLHRGVGTLGGSSGKSFKRSNRCLPRISRERSSCAEAKAHQPAFRHTSDLTVMVCDRPRQSMPREARQWPPCRDSDWEGSWACNSLLLDLAAGYISVFSL